MTTFNLTSTNTIVEHTCINCGCLFYVPQTFDTHRRRDKESFYCYNGHSQAYVKSTAETLQEKLDNLERSKNYEIAQLKQQVSSLTPKPPIKRKARRAA